MPFRALLRESPPNALRGLVPRQGIELHEFLAVRNQSLESD